MTLSYIIRTVALVILCALPAVSGAKPANGRNNHDWRTTTDALRATLESTGLFAVEVSTAPEDLAPPMPPKPKVEDAAYLAAKQQRDEVVKNLRPAMDAAWAKWSVEFLPLCVTAILANFLSPVDAPRKPRSQHSN